MNMLLIGCGNVGFSLLNLWVERKLFTKIVVIQPTLSQAKHFENNLSVLFVDSLLSIPKNFIEDITVLAVKPQQFKEVSPFLKARNGGLLLSPMTGVSIEQLVSAMPSYTRVVRFMPNMAIKTGKSVNLMVASKEMDLKSKLIFEEIVAPTGNIFWLDKEEDLDNLTPISGSGPAFFFLLAALLCEEATKRGIKETMASQIIAELFIGSASLITSSSSYEALIESVSSKKGVTAAALAIMRPQMTATIKESIEAALVRGRELADENPVSKFSD